MAVFQFSALSDGQSLAFNSTADVLNFDQTTVAAADLRVTQVGNDIRIDVVSGTQAGKDVTLQNMSLFQLATTNVTFADGSRLLFGDNSPATQNDNLANSLSGTAGRDLLQGFIGADTMAGGAGNDTYIVGTGDVLSDTGGVDTVLSDITWALADGFENLTLTGTGNIAATGNNATNLLVGNSGNNFFNPRSGDDTIQAGAGNDLIRLGGGGLPSYGNKVIDGGAGFDQVEFGGFAKSAIVVDLAAGTLKGGGDAGQGSATLISIESVVGDAFNDKISGSGSSESLGGGGGNDTLDGRDGNDTLTGGLGADTFVFANALSSSNRDLLTDFASATDKLSFDNAVFNALGAPGNFASGDTRFVAGAGLTSGQDASDRLIYNTTTGQLFFDADGNGAGASVLVATLQGAPALVATDIVVTGQSGLAIQGTAGNDTLTGMAGNDTIDGLGGNDLIRGLDGADSLIGGAGNDSLDAGAGTDTLSGGLGADTFAFTTGPVAGNADQVTDFLSGTDKLSFDNNAFNGLGPAGEFASGDARFLAGPGLTQAPGNERLVYNTTTGQLFFTAQGDLSTPVLVATLQGAPALAATDIVVTGRATIVGTAGNDSLTGTTADDSILGLGGNDTIDGLGGPDTIRGGDGDDTLIDHVNGGPDMPAQILDGGLGNDTYDLLANPNDASPGALITDAGGIDTVLANNFFLLPAGIENLTLFQGTRGVGNELNNVIETRTNAIHSYSIDGAGGDDTLIGGVDSDTMTGGTGNDVFVFSQPPSQATSFRSDQIQDFASGSDRLLFDNAGFAQLGGAGSFAPGDPRFASGAGLTSGQDATDRLIYDSTNGDLYYDADGNGAGTSVLVAHLTGAPALVATDIVVTGQSGPGTIQGTEGNDFLVGTLGNDSIDGLGGDDIILGNAGDDTLVGGAGNDGLLDDYDSGDLAQGLKTGNDQISGGGGDDEIVISRGNDSVDAGAGNDLIRVEQLEFGSDIDTIDGGDGVDTLKIVGGIAAVDLAAGTLTYVNDASSHATFTSMENVTLQAGSSLVSGTNGANQLAGYSGDDTLNGRAGNDTLTGDGDGFGGFLARPAGADHFVFDQTPGAANADLIVDFHSASDTLDLDVHAMAALGPSARFATSDARFHAAAGATGGHDADDRIVYDTSTGNLYYDADGSGAGSGQLIATLQGAPALTATDIVVFGGDGAPGVHVVGTEGNDTLSGTDGNDTIDGLGGDDVLSGGFGTDILHGGAGNDRLKDREDSNLAAPDTLDGGLGDDIYDFLANPLRAHSTVIVDAGGVDTVWSNHDFALPTGIENLTLFEGKVGTGNELGNMMVAFGNVGQYTMDGAGGNDTLLGATNSLEDMRGGAGSDVFAFSGPPADPSQLALDHLDDFVSGTDTIQLDNTGFANLGAPGRFSATDERFFSAFGARAAHDASDRVIYDQGSGVVFYDPDGTGPAAIRAVAFLQGANPALVASDIVVVGASAMQGTAGNDSLTGTEGNDSIAGLAGSDTINALGGNDTLDGGAGIDTMNGGLGDDTYIVTAGDVLSDTGGVDTVVSDANWILADGFENLTAIGPAGVGLTGNNGANVLFGNAASNFFNPRGGDDTIRGGDGADLVRLGGGGVPSYGNKLIDGGAGFDTLEFGGFGRSAIVVDLAAGSLVGGGDAGQGSATLISIERVNGDGFNDRISGSALAEELNGGGGNDTLDGRGGMDTLTGGLGADAFVFDTAPASGNVDQVTDFVSASDRLNFDNAAFTALGTDGNFVAGDARFAAGAGFTSGRDASDRVVYDTNTGNLYYDADGSGTGAAQLVATLQGHPALAATDINVI